MVTREELNRSYKLKILLRGPTGTSKTFSAVKVAEYVSKKGWKTLYLDNEKGCDEELMKLDDKALGNIIRIPFRNYKQIMDAIKKYQEEEKDKLKVIIIDPMHLIEMTRISARDAFLDQGYYYLGEKKIEIDNKDTYDLKGFQYQLATTYQFKLLDEIVNCDQDIVCTLMTPNKNETAYDGKFSIVLETFTAWVGNKIYYKAIPKKFRGIDLSTMPAIDDPHKKLLEGFTRKYGTMPNLKKENNEKKENNDEKEIIEKENNDNVKIENNDNVKIENDDKIKEVEDAKVQ